MSWVKWLQTRRLVTSSPDETVLQAAERMVERGVGSILLVDDDKLTGIFSERDLLTRVIARGKDPAATRVDEVCTRDPKVVREDAELSECARLVKEYGVRHIPVVSAGRKPVGMISVRDFLHYVLDGLESTMERAYHEKRVEQLTDPYAVGGEDVKP